MHSKEQLFPLELSIEPLTEADISQLEPILIEHVRDSETGEILQDEINEIKEYMKGAADKDGRQRTYLVAKDIEGRVVGCMAYAEPDSDMLRHFNTTPDESAELLNAFVSSEVYRGGGIGRKLFEAICNTARQAGKGQLLINSGPRYEASWGFYDKVCDESCGFIKGKYNGFDAKTWRKSL